MHAASETRLDSKAPSIYLVNECRTWLTQDRIMLEEQIFALIQNYAERLPPSVDAPAHVTERSERYLRANLKGVLDSALYEQTLACRITAGAFRNFKE